MAFLEIRKDTIKTAALGHRGLGRATEGCLHLGITATEKPEACVKKEGG
jgi:hypothetical protein